MDLQKEDKVVPKEVVNRLSNFVCHSCGIIYGTVITGVAASYKGTCGICGREAMLLHIRHFSYLNLSS